MMAWREASFFESWWTITAALLTTTWMRNRHVTEPDKRHKHRTHSADTYLVFVIEQFGEFWYGSGCQLSVILIVNQIDHSMFEHL